MYQDRRGVLNKLAVVFVGYLADRELNDGRIASAVGDKVKDFVYDVIGLESDEENSEGGDGAGGSNGQSRQEKQDTFIDRLIAEGKQEARDMLQPIFEPLDFLKASFQLTHGVVDLFKGTWVAMKASLVELALPIVKGLNGGIHTFGFKQETLHSMEAYLQCYKEYYDQILLALEAHAKYDVSQFDLALDHLWKVYGNPKKQIMTSNSRVEGMGSIGRRDLLKVFMPTAHAAGRDSTSGGSPSEYGLLNEENQKYYRALGKRQEAQAILRTLQSEKLSVLAPQNLTTEGQNSQAIINFLNQNLRNFSQVIPPLRETLQGVLKSKSALFAFRLASSPLVSGGLDENMAKALLSSFDGYLDKLYRALSTYEQRKSTFAGKTLSDLFTPPQVKISNVYASLDRVARANLPGKKWEEAHATT